jgi:hypothetical protein
MELLFVINGEVGIGPITDKKENLHRPLVYFRRGRTIVGDYSILFDKPSFATYRAYGEEICDCLAIPKQPLM